MELTRRRMLVLSAAGVSASAMAAAGASDDESSLAGGTMALTEAYKVAAGVWIGPDSAKSTVSADAGNIYMASDTDVDYYGDGGSWAKRDVGSPSEPVQDLHSQSVNTEHRDITDETAYALLDTDSDDATGGDGTRANPFTGGVLQAAIDEKDNAIGREVGAVRILGNVLEDNIDGQGGTRLEGQNLHTKIQGVSNSGNPVLAISSGDWKIPDVWIQAPGNGKGMELTGREIWIRDGEVEHISGESPTHGIHILNTDSVWIDNEYIASSAWTTAAVEIEDSTEVFIDDLRVEGGDTTINTNDGATEHININGLLHESGEILLEATKVNATNLYSTGSGRGILVTTNGGTSRVAGIAEDCGSHGWTINGTETTAYVNSQNNGGKGIRLGGTDSTVFGAAKGNTETNMFIQPGATRCAAFGTFDDAHLDGGNCAIAGTVRANVTWDANATDCNFVHLGGQPTVTDNGATRPRWDGIIGGGPLGGVDLGSTTGQFVGDAAVADGTTSTPFLTARWTGSAWQPSDGSATITPA